jgi:hypothetical protein
VSPKKPKSHVKNEWLKVRATTVQLERWQRAAKLARLENDEVDYSNWVRTTLNDAAKALESRHGVVESGGEAMKQSKGGGR